MKRQYFGFMNGKPVVCITGKLLTYIETNVSFSLFIFKQEKCFRANLLSASKTTLTQNGIAVLKSKNKIKTRFSKFFNKTK